MNIESLLDLYDHMAWADAEVWTAVLNYDPACEDAKLRDSLYHLHVVQRVYLRMWRGESLEAPYPAFEQTSELGEWAKTYYGDARRYLETLTEAKTCEAAPRDWAQRMERSLGRGAASLTLGPTMMQVPLHSLYHRGQVNTRLRELGATPPLVDFIAWVWLGRPSPAWPTGTGLGTPD